LSNNLKNVLVWLAVVVSLVLLWQLFYSIREVNIEEKDFSTFYKEMTEKKIKSAKIMDEELEGEDLSGRKFKTIIPADQHLALVKDLNRNGVSVKFEKSSNSSFLHVFLFSWFPFILLIGFWIFLIIALVFLTMKLLDKRKSRS
jgi:cell division protease FtsH